MQMEELDRIRAEINDQLGRRIWLKAHWGRSRSMIAEGVLESAFPTVFTVTIQNEGESSRMSYTYGDILCKNLEWKVLE